MRRRSLLAVFAVAVAAAPLHGHAFDPKVMDSVVSVIPLWPGHKRGGEAGTPPGSAPEGSGIAVLPSGLIATSLHVVDRATEITVRLRDGRQVPATLAAGDPPTDIALLRITEDLPVLPVAPEPRLGAPVCAVGNQFGLDLSVTCGVVSATRRSGTGFNPVEDFVQTDAVVNPGSSGGALVDADGRLVGMLSAIFTKDSDANIGVNFAVSAALLMRVVGDLAEAGQVLRPRLGIRVSDLSAEEARREVGVRVIEVFPDSAAAAAGLQVGDYIVRVADREIRKAGGVTTAVQLQRRGDRITIELRRDGAAKTVEAVLGQ